MISVMLYDPRMRHILDQRTTFTRTRVFTAASPLDFRYVNPELVGYTSEAAKFVYWGLDEAANVLTLLERKLVPEKIADEILSAVTRIDAEVVYSYEYGNKSEGIKGLNHDVRAYLKQLCEMISEQARPFTHAFKTSYDKINTADAARTRDAILDVVIPTLKKLLQRLIALVRKYFKTVQVGRTHLQHASPVTFGFALAEFVSRLGENIVELEKAARDLRGKLSGPVGTCAPTMIKVTDPRRYERQALKKLGLKPSPYSHQTVMAKYMANVAHVLVLIGGDLGNLADNMRDLERPEIRELSQIPGKAEGSSSVMPHKVNPIAWENTRSLLKELTGRMFSRYQDLITMHQRELTNSASGRFLFEMIEMLLTMTKSATRALSGMQVHEDAMQKNLMLTRDQVISEPLNTILRWLGHPDAHEASQRLARAAHEQQVYIYDLLMQDAELQWYVDRMSSRELSILKDQKKYVGDSRKTSLRLARMWEKRLKLAA